MAYDIRNLLNKAIKQPDMFYQNYIASGALADYQIVSVDEMPFCCVYSFVFLNSDKGTEFSDLFLKNYAEDILSERDKIHDDVPLAEFAKLTSLCPKLNKFLFRDEWNVIKKCNSIEDFKSYLSENAGRCEEFDLYAKYQISQKENSFFEDYNTVLKKYYNSVLFDISALKKKCYVINGIPIMWNDMISDEQKDAITSILEGFEKVGSEFALSKPITNKQFHIIANNYGLNMLNRLHDDLGEPAIVSYYDTEKFVNSLKRLASITSYLLSPDIIIKSQLEKPDVRNLFVDLLEWRNSEDIVECAYAIFLDSSRGYKQSKVMIPKNSYATFRITI